MKCPWPGRARRATPLAGVAGHDQRAVGQRGVGVGRDFSAQAARLRVKGQRVCAGLAARGNHRRFDVQDIGKRIQMGASLHAGAHDQQGAFWPGRQPLGRQRRDGRRTARGDGGTVQQQSPRASGHMGDDHIALDGGASTACVGGCERDQLGDGNVGVVRWHDEQAAATGQGLHQPRGHMNLVIEQQLHQFLEQSGPGQGGGGLGRSEYAGFGWEIGHGPTVAKGRAPDQWVWPAAIRRSCGVVSATRTASRRPWTMASSGIDGVPCSGSQGTWMKPPRTRRQPRRVARKCISP
jgi:hypothetical protein